MSGWTEVAGWAGQRPEERPAEGFVPERRPNGLCTGSYTLECVRTPREVRPNPKSWGNPRKADFGMGPGSQSHTGGPWATLAAGFSFLDLSTLLYKSSGLKRPFLLSLPTSCTSAFIGQAKLSHSCSALAKGLQMTDGRNSIWLVHSGENEAASCVFMWACKWDSVSLSGGRGSGPGQNHFQSQVPGSRTMIYLGEMLGELRRNGRDLFPQQLCTRFPLKTGPQAPSARNARFSMELCSEALGRGLCLLAGKPHESLHCSSVVLRRQLLLGSLENRGVLSGKRRQAGPETLVSGSSFPMNCEGGIFHFLL